MKIIFLTSSLGSGGSERVVSLLCNKMMEQGHDVEIVCLKYNDVYYKLNQDVKVVLAMQQTKNRLTEIFWLRDYIKKDNPDVVIPFTEGVYCFTILALLGTRIPIIASERLDPASMSTTRRVLKRLLLPYVDWMVVQTQSIKEHFPKKLQEKISIIYNPVNDEVFNRSITNDNKEDRIISIARLYPQKNQQLMIRAFAKVVEKYPNWKLYIFGDGPLRSNLECLISQLKLDGKVLLPGRTNRVLEELDKSKIFCLTSDYEGMSNSMIEAICMGLPVVTTNVSGANELIKNGKNGFIVNIGDENDLINRLLTLMGSIDLQDKMSKNNQQMMGLFNIESILSQWIQLIIKIVHYNKK